MLKCVENPAAGGVTLNVGRGEPVSIMELARLLGRTMRSDIEPRTTGRFRVGDIRHNFADISRLKEVIGIEPRISLEAGLKRFCEWACAQPIPDDLLANANEELEARNLMG